MATTLLLAGDVNLMNVTDTARPFARVAEALRDGDVRFANLECCFFDPAGARSTTDEGFYARPPLASALTALGIDVVGTANNVNYGSEAIVSSLRTLDAHGIAHTGSGANAKNAHEPAVVERNGVRIGFLQRTSVYWPTGHEAGEHTPGVAALRGHTAYRVPAHKTRPEIPPMNRPGIPPEVMTWADASYLDRLREDVKRLRQRCDIVVASHHWGLHEEVLEYMTQIAHAAIDAGADLVIGHGPHFSLPVEIYRGKPVFYGLGSFSFHTGHGALKHGDWIGMLARVTFDGHDAHHVTFRFVRHDAENQTYICDALEEAAALSALQTRSATYGATLEVQQDRVTIRARRASVA